MAEHIRNQPLVSIAMPFFNCEDTILLSIQSILNQTYNNWELYIIDDGSNDDSLNIAKSIKDRRIILLHDGQNLGLASRLNQIIDICKGKYFARLDADDIAYPERIERQVNYLESHIDIDLLGTGSIYFDENGTPLSLFPVKTEHSEICKNPWNGFYLAHPTWMGKTSWFKKYHYRCENKRAEDQDLLLRAYKYSHFAALPEILLGYRQEKKRLNKILRSRYYMLEALLRQAYLQQKYYYFIITPIRQAIKSLVDLITIPVGLDNYVNQYRNIPLKDEEIHEWNKVWVSINNKTV